jgi:hypothetical protein
MGSIIKASLETYTAGSRFLKNPRILNRSLKASKPGALIARYAEQLEIPFIADKQTQTVEIGAYSFSRPSFHELITYVWRGGYPRWKDEAKPDYVLAMKRAIEQKKAGLFKGIAFIESPSAFHA